MSEVEESIVPETSVSQDKNIEVTNMSSSESNEANRLKISRKEEVLRMLENKKKAEEDNFTFKPKLVDSKRFSKKDIGATKRYEKLYEDAKKKIDLEKASKPELKSPASRSVSKDTSDLVDRLYNSKVGKITSPLEEPSFKPSITKRAISIERSRDFAEKLHEDGAKLREKLVKQKEDFEQQYLASCTFHPKINENSKEISSQKSASEPFYERLRKYELEKLRKIEQARLAKEEQEKSMNTFHPVVQSAKKFTEDVYDRLSKSVTKEPPEKCPEETFTPNLISKQPRSPFRERTPVHDRLYHDADQRRVDLETERDKIKSEELKNLTFSPMVGSHGSSKESVFQRLVKDSENKQYLQMKWEQEKVDSELKECTFKPTIGSPTASSNRTNEVVFERLAAEAERMRQDLKKKEELKHMEMLKEATFAPLIPESSHVLALKRKESLSKMTLDAFLEGTGASETINSAPTSPKKAMLTMTPSRHSHQSSRSSRSSLNACGIDNQTKEKKSCLSTPVRPSSASATQRSRSSYSSNSLTAVSPEKKSRNSFSPSRIPHLKLDTKSSDASTAKVLRGKKSASSGNEEPKESLSQSSGISLLSDFSAAQENLHENLMEDNNLVEDNNLSSEVSNIELVHDDRKVDDMINKEEENKSNVDRNVNDNDNMGKDDGEKDQELDEDNDETEMTESTADDSKSSPEKSNGDNSSKKKKKRKKNNKSKVIDNEIDASLSESNASLDADLSNE